MDKTIIRSMNIFRAYVGCPQFKIGHVLRLSVLRPIHAPGEHLMIMDMVPSDNVLDPVHSLDVRLASKYYHTPHFITKTSILNSIFFSLILSFFRRIVLTHGVIPLKLLGERLLRRRRRISSVGHSRSYKRNLSLSLTHWS